MNKFYIIVLAFIFMNDSNKTIFDFNTSSDIYQWKVVDDVVMGGKSNGSFKINKDGNGEFSGLVSLENNGGFSSLRYDFKSKETEGYKFIVLKVKGDGKKYQFRLKDDKLNKHSYISIFETNGEWQTIKITLSEMYPAFRGVKLNIGDFSSSKIDQIAFLIGNKKAQKFKLEIDEIFFQ